MAPDLTAHAGRWVVLVGDLVTGVGDTPDEALSMAQHGHPEAPPRLRFVELPGGEQLKLSPLLDTLAPFLLQLPFPVYLVGGAIRDALLGRPPQHDLDFIVPDQAIRLAFQIADLLNMPAYVLDQERDVGRVVLAAEGTILDFARFRGPDLEADLWDRDFTINSMALPAIARRADSIIDPCGGQDDLKARLIRQTRESAIADDPVRALRALRIALDLEFTLTAETARAISQAGLRLGRVSAERLRDEMLKLLQTELPFEAVSQMAKFDLLPELLPEVAALSGLVQPAPHHELALAHTVSVLRWLAKIEDGILAASLAADPALSPLETLLCTYADQLTSHLAVDYGSGLNGRMLLRLAALFHDVGKASTKSIEETGRIRFIGHEQAGATLTEERLRHLCFSKKAIAHVVGIVAGHMRPLQLTSNPPAVTSTAFSVSRRAIYRFFRDTGAAGIDISLLSLADHLATHNGPGDTPMWHRLLTLVNELFRHYYEQHQNTVSPLPLLNGRDLMDLLHLEPGPEIGRLLRLLEESQAAGEITNSEQAIQFARHNYRR